MRNEDLQDLLTKYLNGNTTPEESDRVDEWYRNQEGNVDDIRLIDSREHAALEMKILERIKATVAADHTHNILDADSRGPINGVRANRNPTFYRIAAAITLISLVGIAALLFREKRNTEVPSVAADQTSRLLRVANHTTSATKKVLSDGTAILLQPNGSIEFPDVFAGDVREIQLTGEAFFDVAKDSNRPFIINTGDIAVKVLGTSFNVKAYQGSKEISVAVKSGKVSVYAKRPNHNDSSLEDEIILTPNQEVVYNTVRENFSKKIVDEPRILLERPTLFHTRYDATPVAKIFEELEENYGIHIVFDDDALAGCTLTTSMDEEGLYERIIIICQAIGAQYELKDGMILISSKGCQ